MHIRLHGVTTSDTEHDQGRRPTNRAKRRSCTESVGDAFLGTKAVTQHNHEPDFVNRSSVTSPTIWGDVIALRGNLERSFEPDILAGQLSAEFPITERTGTRNMSRLVINHRAITQFARHL